MPILVKPIIDRNLPPIYKNNEIYTIDLTGDSNGTKREQNAALINIATKVNDNLYKVPITIYMFCFPFQNGAAVGESTYNTIYAKISAVSNYSYEVRPAIQLTPLKELQEDFVAAIQAELAKNGISGNAAEDLQDYLTYFSDSFDLLTRLGGVTQDNDDAVVCIHLELGNEYDRINLTDKSFYKVQLAYGYTENNQNQISAYSDYGISKCVNSETSPIILKMPGFDGDAINLQTSQALIGEFTSQDLGERVSTYRFSILDLHKDDVVLWDSGWQAHNSNSDVILPADDNNNPIMLITSTDSAKSDFRMRKNEVYRARYEVYTTNKIYKTIDYAIVDQDWGSNDWPATIIAENDYDNGRIRIYCNPNNYKIVAGQYRLEKASQETSYTDWEPVTDIYCYDSNPQGDLFYDYNIEQGRTYKYSIYKYGRTIEGREVRTARLYTRPVTADFEDIFLTDETRQLAIRFNPQISQFKTVKLENKIETIGGKYPYLSRNGHTNYKQFSISGLISVLSDPSEQFLWHPEIQKYDYEREATSTSRTLDYIHDFYDTNLDSWNVTRERDFKLEVLDWLNNGKPKMLRTAAEGNYIVQLQGVSLAPQQQLGRMLHTFSATAYEVEDFNATTLKKMGLQGDSAVVIYKHTIAGLNIGAPTPGSGVAAVWVYDKDALTKGQHAEDDRIGAVTDQIRFKSKISGATIKLWCNDDAVNGTASKTYITMKDDEEIQIFLEPQTSVKRIEVSGVSSITWADGTSITSKEWADKTIFDRPVTDFANLDTFEITILNYMGDFVPASGEFNFFYHEVLLEQARSLGTVQGDSQASDVSPLCIKGARHLPDEDREVCRKWLDEDETHMINAIYQVKFTQIKDSKPDNVTQEEWLAYNMVWDGSYIGINPRNGAAKEEDIIWDPINEPANSEIKNEFIMYADQLDDITVLMAGSNIRAEIAYSIMTQVDRSST